MASPRRSKGRVLAIDLTAPRKPMATARRVSLFSRSVSVRLSPLSPALLATVTSQLSEGAIDDDRYCGSTMLTIDLAALSDRVSDRADVGTAQRLAGLVPDDSMTRAQARAIAIDEAQRIAGCPLRAPNVDVRARAVDGRVHVDLNIEADRRTT